MKSRSGHYGAVAVSLHWISAILILALIGSGFLAASAANAVTKAGTLRFHIPVAIVVLLLTAFRVVWWWRVDRKPLPPQGTSIWQERIARWVHVALYILALVMIASGIGMMVLSGAGPAVFGVPGALLPNSFDYPPRGLHGRGAFLLVALLVFHAGAALYHQFIRRDGLLRRMWYS
ncbi:cytochrome B561 [Ralstonia pseudosolanacearum]|nr:cytochrome B561 [Ralstonia pseudosolanacearum]QOK88377.1 cytochrome b [Ralstonia pseudosolanacearum]